MKSPSWALPTGRPTRLQAVSPDAQAAARWNEVFLPRIEIAGSVAFEIGGISARTILADLIGTGQAIWDEDAGVIVALPPDDLAVGERVNASQAGAFRQSRVDPTGLQGRMVG